MVEPRVEKWWCSPWVRCLETLSPAVEKLYPLGVEREVTRAGDGKIRVESGLGEWFGTARFSHPSPARPEVLHKLFPRYDLGYGSVIVPDVKGESIEELHDRVAYALYRIVERCDREGVRAIAICSHAATIIAIGRVLTGRMPVDVGEEDFKVFCCGLSKFVRRNGVEEKREEVEVWRGMGEPIPMIEWRGGKGVGGGWVCEVNGDCSFLSGGEERGW